jgi:hypothetical protein
MKNSIPLIAAVMLAACAPLTPKPEQVQAANYGPKPSHELLLALVKDDMSRRLKDPYSAVFECGEPRKAWVNWYGSFYFGYVATCNINAKNSYGAYAGMRPYAFMINNGSVTLQGDSFANVGYLP